MIAFRGLLRIDGAVIQDQAKEHGTVFLENEFDVLSGKERKPTPLLKWEQWVYNYRVFQWKASYYARWGWSPDESQCRAINTLSTQELESYMWFFLIYSGMLNKSPRAYSPAPSPWPGKNIDGHEYCKPIKKNKSLVLDPPGIVLHSELTESACAEILVLLLTCVMRCAIRRSTAKWL